MTYKAALANLKLGGGKTVIIGDSATEKTPEKLRAFWQMHRTPQRSLHYRRRCGHLHARYERHP